MRTQRGHIKEVLSWLVRRAYRAVTAGFCSALAALVGPVQNIFFLAVQYFDSFIQQTRQAALLGHLSVICNDANVKSKKLSLFLLSNFMYCLKRRPN